MSETTSCEVSCFGHKATVVLGKPDPEATYYQILFKPMSSKTWTPVSADTHENLTHPRAETNWFSDWLAAMKLCQHFNELGLQRWLSGVKQWDRLIFKVAKVEIVETPLVLEGGSE